MAQLPDPVGPWGYALVDRNTLLLDPRVMNAVLLYMQSNLDLVQIVRLTQAEYDALTPEQKDDPLTIYVIPVA